MPRRCRIHFVSLRSSLVNLPISLYGPLVERGVVGFPSIPASDCANRSHTPLQRPQGLAVHLTLVSSARKTLAASSSNAPPKLEVYVGWTGMASASSLAHFSAGDDANRGMETIEIDPQYAEGLGFALGDVVRP